MSKKICTVSVILYSFLSSSFGQVIPDSGAPSQAENQALFSRYFTEKSKSESARIVLERVSVYGIPATKANIETVQKLLSSSVSDHEKKSAVRLLAGMYTSEDKFGLNASILKELTSQVRANNRDIARAATFAFSRLGYFPNSTNLLSHAQRAHLITKDEYFGELAHIVKYAPSNDQVLILSKIAHSKNGYSAEILASFAQDANWLQRFGPQSKSILEIILEKNRPEFPQAVGEYGFVDAFRYENWLHASAVLAANSGKVKYEDFVLEHLNSEKTDPRQILAFLSSEKGKALMSSVGESKRFAPAYARLSQYSHSFPSNAFVGALAKGIEKTLQPPNGTPTVP
jgi:hypothetical protein